MSEAVPPAVGSVGEGPQPQGRRIGSDRAWRRGTRPLALVVLPVLAVLTGGCEGVQSAFSVFGEEAESTRRLAIVMFGGATLITIGVLLLAWHAVRTPEGRLGHDGGMRLILWLGAVFPTVVLTLLLVWALPTMRTLAAEENGLEIAVDGEQFWWRVSYRPAGGEPVQTANEVRVPVGRTVTFLLDSPDVIHSFWIPGLAGKVDMIPGRTNRLVARATRAGEYRGVCAEFCGVSHARMAFDVVAMEPEAFERWLAEQAREAAPEASGEGRALFDGYGCAGCHAVRGHFAGSPIGPDLTHVGSRRSVAAATLPMDLTSLARFVRNANEVKPGSLMPTFTHMPPEHAEAIAGYLAGLR